MDAIIALLGGLIDLTWAFFKFMIVVGCVLGIIALIGGLYLGWFVLPAMP